jgi:hypothetical protein
MPSLLHLAASLRQFMDGVLPGCPAAATLARVSFHGQYIAPDPLR